MIEYLLERFKVTPSLLRELVAEGLREGAGWCDLYFEKTEYFDLLLRDGVVSSGGSHLDYGCGVRALSGEKTGYAYAESTDRESLKRAARAAASIAAGTASHVTAVPDMTSVRTADMYPQSIDWRCSDILGFSRFLGSIEAEIRRREPRTVKVVAMISFSVSEILMYNSLGELSGDIRPLGSVTANVVFKSGEKVESRYVSRSFRCGSEMLSDAIRDALAGDAVRGLDAAFEARRPKGGKMPVVIAAGAGGILLHEAMGHAFEADFLRKGQSIFEGRLGEKVARSGINIVDDGTLGKNRGSCALDDEGVAGQKTYMVRDGVLNSFLHDRISAGCFGVAPTGNGRRESFRYNPVPRMRTTYMESGPDGSAEDLVASIKKGIYVDQFANGQVKIGEGDFTFYVKSGYTIENGRLAMPVKDINIIGNGPEALADIRAVAGDLKIDDGTWTCGKEQSVPVGCGIPTVLVGSLTVGGE